MMETDPSKLSFEEAFEIFIKDKKVVNWGFRMPNPVKMDNGFNEYPCGYYTEYENGYKLIVFGSSFGNEQQQEIRVLDANDKPVGYKDREDIVFD
ncbi:hypothetical protein [Pedobacter flavus]|uniref:Uncharacterized protein n=1 Tax=Pedobacter flavus TaxID=3113906 RepID=A0ABU7H1Y7_9SPHI|nr:hypothetical protein [Pedobacter sp. VNH31]MEE1885327.1 hypothetical protein [Pedobacter sp. VNH31]